MTDPIAELSRRQRELLELIATGVVVSKDLSARIGIAPRTIDNLLYRAARTLGVTDREAAAERYIQLQENCHDPCHVTSPDLVSPARTEPKEDTGTKRKAFRAFALWLFGLPLGGEEHFLRWDQVTLQVLRVAFIGLLSLTALVIFVLAFFRTFG